MTAYEFMQDCYSCNFSYKLYTQQAKALGYDILSQEEYDQLDWKKGEQSHG